MTRGDYIRRRLIAEGRTDSDVDRAFARMEAKVGGMCHFLDEEMDETERWRMESMVDSVVAVAEQGPAALTAAKKVVEEQINKMVQSN